MVLNSKAEKNQQSVACVNRFSTLGVGADADDDQIKQRYLSLVRMFPPPT